MPSATPLSNSPGSVTPARSSFTSSATLSCPATLTIIQASLSSMAPMRSSIDSTTASEPKTNLWSAGLASSPTLISSSTDTCFLTLLRRFPLWISPPLPRPHALSKTGVRRNCSVQHAKRFFEHCLNQAKFYKVRLKTK